MFCVFFLRCLLLLLTCLKFFLEELDDVEIGRGDLLVVFLDLGILLLMLEGALLDLRVLAGFNHGDLLLAAAFHLSAEVDHSFLVLELDLVAEAFVVVTHLGHFLVERPMQRISILLLTCVLLLLRYLQTAQICLQLPLLHPMFIFCVLQRNLGLFLQSRQLIRVLEHQMHQSLHVDLDLDLVFLLQVLILALLVTKFRLLVFQLLLTHHPEVTDADTFVIIHVS